MKRVLIIALLICAVAALLCVAAYADDPSGIYALDVKEVTGITATVTPSLADGTAVQASAVTINETAEQLYADAVKLKVTLTITGTPAAQYLILAQSEDATPTRENIRYINQDTPNGTTVEFNVYPDKLEDGTTYYISIAGTGGTKTPIATFKYFVPYTLGDVNNNGDINATDASVILQYCVASAQNKPNVIPTNLQPAADVNKNGDINTTDASLILQYCVASAKDKPGFFAAHQG